MRGKDFVGTSFYWNNYMVGVDLDELSGTKYPFSGLLKKKQTQMRLYSRTKACSELHM